jgi:hypothetical protein
LCNVRALDRSRKTALISPHRRPIVQTLDVSSGTWTNLMDERRGARVEPADSRANRSARRRAQTLHCERLDAP